MMSAPHSRRNKRSNQIICDDLAEDVTSGQIGLVDRVVVGGPTRETIQKCPRPTPFRSSFQALRPSAASRFLGQALQEGGRPTRAARRERFGYSPLAATPVDDCSDESARYCSDGSSGDEETRATQSYAVRQDKAAEEGPENVGAAILRCSRITVRVK
jgi:hypothetical protein